jgi:hypothetical protein
MLYIKQAATDKQVLIMFWKIPMLLSFLGGVLGMLIVMASWFALQAYIRKQSPRSADTDLLEYMAHGCGLCPRSVECAYRQAGGDVHTRPPLICVDAFRGREAH